AATATAHAHAQAEHPTHEKDSFVAAARAAGPVRAATVGLARAPAAGDGAAATVAASTTDRRSGSGAAPELGVVGAPDRCRGGGGRSLRADRIRARCPLRC